MMIGFVLERVGKSLASTIDALLCNSTHGRPRPELARRKPAASRDLYALRGGAPRVTVDRVRGRGSGVPPSGACALRLGHEPP